MTVRSDSASATRQAVVRTATLADAPRIAQLSGQFGYPATAEEVTRRLEQLEDDARHAVYLAEAPPGQVIGWIHVHEVRLVEADLRAEVSGLVVADGFRGRGAGRILMQQAEAWARERGCGWVLLRSNVLRAGAHAFYDRLGYENIKTQKVFRKKL